MKNKNRILTNNVRTLRRSFPRFVSLMIMSLLGVFVFAGLMATSPDMLTTLDQYLDENSVYDVRVISTMGLTEEDVKAVEALKCVDKAVGSKLLNVDLDVAEENLTIQCNAWSEDLNTPAITEGRAPAKRGEIAVEAAFLTNFDYEIGDVIHIENDSLSSEDLTIVGVVNSPLYYDRRLGVGSRNSALVSGTKVDYYAYVSEDDLDFDYYTVLYATVDGAKELVTSSTEYKALINEALDEIDSISEVREKARYDDIVAVQTKAIDDAEIDAYQALNSRWDDVKPMLEKMLDAKNQLRDAEAELSESKQKLEDARSQLDSAKAQLADSESQLVSSKEQLDEYAEQLESGKTTLEEAAVKLSRTRSILDAYQSELADAKAQLDAAKTKLSDSDALLKESAAKLATAEAQLADGAKQLEDARAQLDSAEAQYQQALTDNNLTEDTLDSTEQTLVNNILTAQNTINNLNDAIAAIDKEIAGIDSSTTYGAIRIAALQATRATDVLLLDTAQNTMDSLKTSLDGVLQLQDAKKQIAANEALYAEKKAEYDAGVEEYNEGKSQYEAGVTAYNEGLAQYASGLEEYAASKAQVDAAEISYAEGYQEYLSGKQQYDTNLATYESYLSQYESGKELYDSKKAEYEEGEKQYDEGLKAYEEGLAAYESGKAEYEEQIEKYKDELSEIGISDPESELNSIADVDKIYDDAKTEIDARIREARQTLSELKVPSWFTYDRTGYFVYGEYLDQTVSIQNLSTIFPLIFFAVAVLVSLISMNRMVEEDRTEIGTLMSLGFGRRRIRSKYLLFSLLATIVGGLIGAVTGLTILPGLIANIYNSFLFDVPSITLTLQPVTTALGFVITILCVCGSSIYTVQKTLREKPSQLMRPKPPKNGKRILLERIHFIWERLSFSQKVTIRNLFRYKKRVLITIAGIMGCTVLILAGYGIKDSIKNLPQEQYGTLFHYDAAGYVENYDPEEFLSQKEIRSIFPIEQFSATAEDQSVYVMVTENAEDMSEYILLRDSVTKNELTLEKGKVIITEKLATVSKLKVGDTISILDTDNNLYELEISGIVDNYISHFIYMTSETYESLGYTFTPNEVLFNTKTLTADQQEALSEKLTSTGDVYTVSYNSAMVSNVANMFSSLDSVVIILIVFSAALCLVVLFNLSNINISERRREIATLKVLGFYDPEVDAYITKETIILTGLGVALGLVLGTFVSKLVVSNVEISYCRFINSVQPISYVWTALFVILFSAVVSFITHMHLKRIDMIDSLKSVE